MIYNKINIYKILNLILIFLLLTSFFGSIVYKLYSLNNIGIFISLILSIIVFIIIHLFLKQNNKKYLIIKENKKEKSTIKNTILPIFYIILFFSNIYILFINKTTQAIISPWEVMPSYFFIIYAIATTILILNILSNSKFSTPLITLHYFLSFSIAVIIYKIGYGFDPFVHEATLDLINKNGSVDPKPFYYLGQYSLIIILHKITFLPIALLNKILVPVLSAIYIPITIKYVLEKWFEDKKIIALTSILILSIPFSFFIITTPQNFTYLLLILAILLGLVCKNFFDLGLIYLISFVAILTQPIAGVPIFFFALLLTAYHSDNLKFKRYYYITISILSAIALPFLFYYFEKNISPENLENTKNKIIDFPKLIMPEQENFILNFIYLYGFNIKLIITIIALSGIIIAYYHKKKTSVFFIYLLMSFSLGVSYLLTKNLGFNFLIDYERNNYSNRLLLISAIFLLPFIITTLYAFINKVLKQKLSIKIPIFIFVIILTTTSLYLSYPRFDRYFNSHGYSTSQNDIDTVKWIEENTDRDYIVLANQQVSAAALSEFGFKKYYKKDIYFYPVPTGGPLYQYYLDMVYEKPTHETMISAMDLAGVNQAYFVLNEYWWASSKILEEAKLTADNWQEIGNKKVWIFNYTK